jgi:hypothetical protein
VEAHGDRPLLLVGAGAQTGDDPAGPPDEARAGGGGPETPCNAWQAGL